MSNQKSIIGCGYIPRKAQAVCLKTDANTQLGEVVYKIIKDPYERVFEHREFFAMMPTRQKRMAVNVLDANTGLTYAVEYEPANLVRTPVEYSWEDLKIHIPKGMRIVPINESTEKKPFADRAQQIAEELAGTFSAGGGFRTSAVLHSLQFRTTETIKHRRAQDFSAVEVIVSRRLLPRHVPRIPKSSKS